MATKTPAADPAAEFYGELKSWLAAHGYTVFESLATAAGWDSQRDVSGAKLCALRGKPPRVHVSPHSAGGRLTAIVYLAGEVDDDWFRFEAKPVSVREIMDRHDAIVDRLASAWDAAAG